MRGRGAGVALVLLLGGPAILAAQVYMEPEVRAAGIRPPGPLASPEAARALGLPVPGVLPESHGRQHRVGMLPVLVLLTRFSDSPEPVVSREQMDDMLFTGSGPTLASFYEEQSSGLFSVGGSAVGWVQTDVPLLDAAGSVNGHGWVGERMGEHITRALEAVDATVDFGQFDNNGPDGVPNSGDDNGIVDALAIKFVEVAGSCGGPGPWPHFGGLWKDGEPAPFESKDLNPSGQAIRIHGYVIDSAVECNGQTPQNMAPLTHELGHVIGLPDYYRAVEGIEPEKRHWAVGCFDLMAAGAWGCGDPGAKVPGFGPTGFSAYSRWVLGWAELEDVFTAEDQTFTLEPLATGGRALRVRLAPESPESWIIEYRTREGFDEPLPAEGVLIYHHDPYRGPRHADPALPPPYPYHLIEADGDDALRKVAAEGGNRGVAADVFAADGPAGPLGWGTAPSTRDHLGGASTLEIHEILVSGGLAAVRLTAGTGFQVAVRNVPGAVHVLQPMSGEIVLSGGVAPYVLDQVRGGIPGDVTVSLSGTNLTVAGTPRAAGVFGLSVWIRDADGRMIADAVRVMVLDDPGLVAGDLLAALVGGVSLGTERENYLDLSGNRDGELDLGDLRAFLQRQPFN